MNMLAFIDFMDDLSSMRIINYSSVESWLKQGMYQINFETSGGNQMNKTDVRELLIKNSQLNDIDMDEERLDIYERSKK